MRKILALCALIGGCASTPPADSPVVIVWNRVDDAHKVCETLSGRKNFFHILGCSQRTEKTCQIYAPEPRNERDLQRFATLGHELMHCFDGNWHDQWGRMTNPNRSLARATESAAAGASSSEE